MASGGGSVTINSITNNSPTSVTVSGYAFGDQYPASNLDLYYGPTAGSQANDNQSFLSGNGAYSVTLTGLTPGTLYYIYAREFDGNTFEFSGNSSFTTLSATSKKSGGFVFFL